MVEVVGLPIESASIVKLYDEHRYRHETKKKLQKMKKNVTTPRLVEALSSDAFFKELDRIKRTYPINDQRSFLHCLVGKS